MCVCVCVCGVTIGMIEWRVILCESVWVCVQHEKSIKITASGRSQRISRRVDWHTQLKSREKRLLLLHLWVPSVSQVDTRTLKRQQIHFRCNRIIQRIGNHKTASRDSIRRPYEHRFVCAFLLHFDN